MGDTAFELNNARTSGWGAFRALPVATAADGKSFKLKDINEAADRKYRLWNEVTIDAIAATLAAHEIPFVDPSAEEQANRDQAGSEANELGEYPSLYLTGYAVKVIGTIAIPIDDVCEAVKGHGITADPETFYSDVKAAATRVKALDDGADPADWSGVTARRVVMSLIGHGDADGEDNGAIRSGVVPLDPYCGADDPVANLAALSGDDAVPTLIHTDAEGIPCKVYRPRYGYTSGPVIELKAAQTALRTYYRDSASTPKALSGLAKSAILGLSGTGESPQISKYVPVEQYATTIARMRSETVNGAARDRLTLPTADKATTAKLGYDEASRLASIMLEFKVTAAAAAARGVKVERGSLGDAVRRGEDGVYLLAQLRNSGHTDLADAVTGYATVSAGSTKLA